MIQRLLERLERSPIGPLDGFLIYLAFILVRLQVEVLFLDPERSLDFFVFNIWYFFSILLSVVLLLAWLTASPPDRVFRAAIPFATVILVPLLDLFFYAHLRQEQLLALCMMPIFPTLQDYGHYLLVEVLGHGFTINSQMSLGLRLEVLTAAIGAGSYALFRAGGSAWKRLVSGAAAYLICLCLIYGHVVAVTHPATRRWVFTLLVCVELVLLLATWNAGALRAMVRRWAWKETSLLVAAVVLGFAVRQAITKPECPAFGEPLLAIVALAALGLWLGHAQARSENRQPESGAAGPDWLMAFLPILSVLAGYLVAPGFFLALGMTWGLAYLGWFSPWRLAGRTVPFSLLAGLALWVTVWSGSTISSLLPPMDLTQPERPIDTVGPGSDALPFTTQWLFHPAWLALPVAIFLGTAAGRRFSSRRVAISSSSD